MEQKQLNKLNRKLGLTFGFLDNRPIYRWVISSELTTFQDSGRFEYKANRAGLIEAKRIFEEVLQLPGEPRWCLAMLCPPPSESAWSVAFGDMVPYPSNGYYIATAAAVKVGQDPTEQLTDFIIAQFLATRRMTDREVADGYAESAQKKESDWEKVVDDFVDNALPAFGNVPGEKNHFIVGGLKGNT